MLGRRGGNTVEPSGAQRLLILCRQGPNGKALAQLRQRELGMGPSGWRNDVRVIGSRIQRCQDLRSPITEEMDMRTLAKALTVASAAGLLMFSGAPANASTPQDEDNFWLGCQSYNTSSSGCTTTPTPPARIATSATRSATSEPWRSTAPAPSPTSSAAPAPERVRV